MRDKPRNDAQQKSQTSVFEAFGFDRLGVSHPGIAEEGDEQFRQTRAKRGPEAKGEAKPEAVFCNGVANVPALTRWLVDHLDEFELAELVRELDHRAIER